MGYFQKAKVESVVADAKGRNTIKHGPWEVITGADVPIVDARCAKLLRQGDVLVEDGYAYQFVYPGYTTNECVTCNFGLLPCERGCHD